MIPEVVFAVRPGHSWDALLFEPSWLRNLELQAIALLGVFGVSAVQEFAQRGNGTPTPYDPPKQLVVRGLYRYISNPMQLSCAAEDWYIVARTKHILTPTLLPAVQKAYGPVPALQAGLGLDRIFAGA
jgi:hypothetical protein